MKKSCSQYYKSFLAGAVLLLMSMACNISSNTQAETLPINAEQSASAVPPEHPSRPPIEVALDASDLCGLLIQEQIEASFGKSVQTIGLAPPGNVVGCDVEFADGNSFDINLFEREIDKQQFATHISGFQNGCTEGFSSFFEVFNPDFPPTPSSEIQILMSDSSLGDLYLKEMDSWTGCFFVVLGNASEIGTNVNTFESVMKIQDWVGSSTVAVVNEGKVVEFSYSEPVSDTAAQELDKATDLASLYSIAEPFRQQVLSGYTEILLDLLKQAVGK
jgi:hypothetical protein